MSVALSAKDFARLWADLPPLVRASAAGNLAEKCIDAARGLHRTASDPDLAMMPRRRRVDEQHEDAFVMLAGLLAGLANDADAEAVKAGVDAIGGSR